MGPKTFPAMDDPKMERCILLWAAEQAKREFQEKKEVFCTDISMTVHLRNLPGPYIVRRKPPVKKLKCTLFSYFKL